MAEDRKKIFDSIHGFISLTETENLIINSPYFQRLRWIRQLGWSHYIFPGATHARFSHALGAMHVMDKIIRAIGKGVDESRLYNLKIKDPKTMFHRKMRLVALLHDIGTFPFSHSTEQGYIRHYRRQASQSKKVIKANHEELGSHIINKTDNEGGITRILKEAGFKPLEISKIIRGESENFLANQLMHSDIDADRIDYLLRDSHHTGVKYGVFDMDYLISNMSVCIEGKREVLAIQESALTAVEYFLISRYSWYTQITKHGTGHKFDMLAARIAEYFIELGMVYSFEELKEIATKEPKKFFGFNDSYFTSQMQKVMEKGFSRNIRLSNMLYELIDMLSFRVAPQQIKMAPFLPSLITNLNDRKSAIDNIRGAVEWLEEKLKALPTGWIIEDIPTKDVIFTLNEEALKRKGVQDQESVRIIDRHQKTRLLIDIPNSLVRVLSTYQNFIPRVYVSRSTLQYLEKKGILDELQRRFSTPPLKKAS